MYVPQSMNERKTVVSGSYGSHRRLILSQRLTKPGPPRCFAQDSLGPLEE